MIECKVCGMGRHNKHAECAGCEQFNDLFVARVRGLSAEYKALSGRVKGEDALRAVNGLVDYLLSASGRKPPFGR